jgi:two-component system, NarL family, sensor kinase
MIKLFFLNVLVILVLACNSLFAQLNGKEYEHLLSQIRASTYGDSSAVFDLGKRAIEIANKLGDDQRVAQIYHYFANFHYYSGRMDLAANYYDTSNIVASKVPDSVLILVNDVRKTFIRSIKDPYNAENDFRRLIGLARQNDARVALVEAYNGLGIIYEDRQDLSSALDYYLKGLKEAEVDKDPRLMGMLYNNIGLIRLAQKQLDGALSDFNNGLKYADLSEDIRLPFNLMNNIGLIYSQQGEKERALDHYKETLIRAKEIGFPYYIAIAYINLGNAKNRFDLPDLAIAYADSAIHLMVEIGGLKNLSKPYFVKSEAYLLKKDFQKALIEIDKGLDSAKEWARIEDEAGGRQLKSRIYEEMGDFKNAFLMFREYHEYSDSLADLSNNKRFQELQMAFNKERSDAELEQERSQRVLVEQERAILEQESQLKQARLTLIIGLLIFIVIAGGGLFYLRHVRITRTQQREFTQKLIDNVDEERSRISRDLHDDIGQSLSFIKSKLNLYGKGNLEALDGLDQEIGQIINQTRSISHSLHPSYLEKIGAKRSISAILDRVEKSTGIITSSEIDDRIDEFAKDIQTQLYRITQECINNTLKHADAKSIRILFERDKDEWMFSYQDNGKGFDVNDLNRSGIGMQTIKERATKIGAKPQIVSSPGKGFRVLLRF